MGFSVEWLLLADQRPWGAAPNPALAVTQPGWVMNQPTPADWSVVAAVSIKGFRGIKPALMKRRADLFHDP